MGAPKKKTKKKVVTQVSSERLDVPFKGTAVKLAIHKAAGGSPPGMYRYVIVGLLVSDKPLDPDFGTSDNTDFGGMNRVAESVGYAAEQVWDAIAFLPKRESKIQGGSADQNLIRLREL